MANPSPDTDRDSSSDFSDPDFGADDPPSWEENEDVGMPDGLSSSLAKDMARSWVQRHQKATMLGAFAVGVFVGAMFRD